MLSRRSMLLTPIATVPVAASAAATKPPVGIVEALAALRKAQAILAEHVEPGGPPASDTINRLLEVLDDEHLLAAMSDDATRRAPRHQALATRERIVAAVWPNDGASRDPAAVSWQGAILKMREHNRRLVVTWKDEDHMEKYRKVADLAWAGVVEDTDAVEHRNGDPGGRKPDDHAILF